MVEKKAIRNEVKVKNTHQIKTIRKGIIIMLEKKKHYTGREFMNDMPEWKRKKDCALARYLFRPVSFYVSAWCANCNISANTVSYISIVFAVLGCLFMAIPGYWWKIAAAIMFNIWYLSDCVDGNLARSIKKQPFGAFADAASSYILVGFMGACIGYAVYSDGGYFVEPGCALMILIGALGTTADTMMRLIYQKYKSCERELQDKGILKVEYDQRIDENATTSLLVRLEEWLGIGGYLAIFILVAAIFNALDIIVFYCFLYYGGAFVLMTLKYCKKTIKLAKQYDDRM